MRRAEKVLPKAGDEFLDSDPSESPPIGRRLEGSATKEDPRAVTYSSPTFRYLSFPANKRRQLVTRLLLDGHVSNLLENDGPTQSFH